MAICKELSLLFLLCTPLRFLLRKTGSSAAVPVAGGATASPSSPWEWEGFFLL